MDESSEDRVPLKVGCVYAVRHHWPVWDWIVRAARKVGCDVVKVTDQSQLAAADAECDVLLFEGRDCGVGWRHVRDYAPQRKAVWAQWHFDLIAQMPGPLIETNYMQSYGEVMKVFDLNFVKERSMIAEFAELGVVAEYMDQGCASDWFSMAHVHDPQFDVLVFGQCNNWYRDRVAAVKRLVDAGYSVGWASNSTGLPQGVTKLPWCHPEQLPELMSRGRCCLDIDMRMDVDGYWSDRHWMIHGAGGIGVRPGVLEMSSVVDIVEMIGRMRRDQREHLGMENRRAVMAEHTYEHRLGDIFASLSRTNRWREKGLPDLRREEDS